MRSPIEWSWAPINKKCLNVVTMQNPENPIKRPDQFLGPCRLLLRPKTHQGGLETRSSRGVRRIRVPTFFCSLPSLQQKNALPPKKDPVQVGTNCWGKPHTTPGWFEAFASESGPKAWRKPKAERKSIQLGDSVNVRQVGNSACPSCSQRRCTRDPVA